jgi:hypothetical protein
MMGNPCVYVVHTHVFIRVLHPLLSWQTHLQHRADRSNNDQGPEIDDRNRLNVNFHYDSL